VTVSLGWRVVLTIALSGLLTQRAARAEAPRLEQMAMAGLNDLQARVAVVKADQDELKKINRDFHFAYRLREIVMRYKEPDKFRMDGRIGQEVAFLIINGSARLVSVPKLGLNKKDNSGAALSKRYSLMEIGLIGRRDLAITQGKFLRSETLNGTPTHVFEIRYRGDDSARNVVWIDARTHVIHRRDWHNGEGRLRASFLYQEAREVQPGLWIPTRIEIRNSDGAVAGITAYSDLKVNQGLDDSLFDIP